MPTWSRKFPWLRIYLGPSRLYGATCEKMLKFRDGPGVRDPREARKSGFSGRKPAGDLAPTCPDHLVSSSALKTEIQPCSLTIFMDFYGNKYSEVSQVFFLNKNHENTTFRASLKPQGPRDRACGKERKILFRIALTRALYDQMAPQLCPFYVPGKLRSFSSFCFVEIWFFFDGLENTWRIKGKSQLVQFV